MKLKIIVVVALILSACSFCVSIWNSLSNINVSSGIRDVEVVKGATERVTFDSKNYVLSLHYFADESGVIQLKVETSEGSQIKNLYFNRPVIFFDLKVLLKERLFNSVLVWIEQIED